MILKKIFLVANDRGLIHGKSTDEERASLHRLQKMQAFSHLHLTQHNNQIFKSANKQERRRREERGKRKEEEERGERKEERKKRKQE